MTPTEAKKIITDVKTEYVSYGNGISAGKADIWAKGLDNLSFKVAKETVKQFIIQNPIDKEKYKGKMPPFSDFGAVYGDVASPVLPDCPCCNNTRWVHIGDASRHCDCTKNQGLPQKCANPMECNPTDVLKCPLGQGHYSKERAKGNEEIKQDPDYQLGRSFLKKGGKLEEIMGGIVGDVGDGETPF